MNGGGGRPAWIDAGQAILREEGASAVKLDALVARTGLTTGSFYHHFAAMADYLDALAARYTELVPTYLTIADVDDPVERLRTVGRLGVDYKMAGLDAAMRDWAAAGFAPAADAIEVGDRQLMAFVAQAFEDLGHDTDGARLRAMLLVSGAVARIATPWDQRRYGLDEVMDVLSPTSVAAARPRGR